MNDAVVIGASGAIGSAFVSLLAKNPHIEKIHALSRTRTRNDESKVISGFMDLTDESSVMAASKSVASAGRPGLIILATGVLHQGGMMPEKALRDLSLEKMNEVFSINTFGPAMVMKYFLPLLDKTKPSVFAALSARVGSISDNRLGGWYSYRASKAALNMLIVNASIECRRTNQNSIIVGIHPGTVDSGLSKPFQANVPSGKLFSPAYAAGRLLEVLNGLTPDRSGKCLDYAGKEVLP